MRAVRVLYDVVQVDAAAAAQNAYEDQISGLIQSGGLRRRGPENCRTDNAALPRRIEFNC